MANEEMVTIRVWAMTNKVNSECSLTFDIEREDWENMTDEDREEVAEGYLAQLRDWGFEEVE